MIRSGQLSLRQQTYKYDLRPIDENCDCSTCKTYTRSYLHHIVTAETVACHLLTVHNIAFQLKLMKDMRTSIANQTFPKFIKDFMTTVYPNKEYPKWILDALNAVNVNLLDS